MIYFYVIMPINRDKLFGQKKLILNEIGRKFGLMPFFPLEEHPNSDLATIITDIQNAQFVLADLSYERPSCYFELGVAQAAGAKVYPIAEERTFIHQMSRPPEVHYYIGIAQYRAYVSELLRGYAVAEGVK